MQLTNFPATAPLSEFVRFYGLVHFTFQKDDLIPSKAFPPRPGDFLCFIPRDPEYVSFAGDGSKIKRPSVFIQGQHTVLTRRFVGRDFLIIIVHFQPGVLYRLTGIPSSELINTHLNAEDVFSKDVAFVNEHLANTNSYQEMIAIVESFLLKRIRRSIKDVHRIDSAARLLLHQTQSVSIDWLAKETCLCHRQFERKFKERMGVSAVLLARIARMEKAFKLKNAYPDADWLSVAIQCGYYDYQHLVRDYKDFTGVTPTAFFQIDSQAPERKLGLHE